MDIDFLRYKYQDAIEGVAIRTNFHIGIRHVQVVYMIACSVFLGIVRGGNGLGIDTMTDLYRLNDTHIQVFDWNKNIQGICLSSFVWGHAIMMIPAELFLVKFKGKIIITIVLFINGTLCCAMPIIAKEGGWVAVMNAQLIMGMTEACLVPSMRTLLDNWLPPHEQRRFNVYVYSGIQLGTVISYPLITSISTSWLGWELVFYSMAIMMFSAAAVWTLLTANSPREHPAVGDKEKEFIAEGTQCFKRKQRSISWINVLKSRSFWALTCAHIGVNAVFLFFLLEIPVYLYYALNVPWTLCGWFTSLAFASLWLTYLAVSPTLEWIYDIGFINYVFGITWFRKLIYSFGFSGVLIGLLCLAYLETRSHWIIVIVLCGILSFTGLQYSGFLECHRDMTQYYPGTLVMMTSVISNGVAAVVPLFTGIILNNNLTDLNRWRIVLLSLASFCLICNVIYVVFGNSERQPWDNTDDKTKFGYQNDIGHLELKDFNEEYKVIEDDDDGTTL